MLQSKLKLFVHCICICAFLSMPLFALFSNGGDTEKTFGEVSLYHENGDIKTSSQGCVLMDASTRDVLFSKNGDIPLPMASTTKIMTALVVLENCPLSETVSITKESVGIEGSSIYLAEGEVLTVKELLYGLLLESGNDAACALALHTAKSMENFCSMMNEKAKALNLSNTHFENPHGLYTENHRTSAYDLCIITAKALENKDFCEMVSTKSFHIKERENCRERYFNNHNRLLSMMENCIGVKTGYTLKAGRCLVSATGTENGIFIAATLNDRDDFADHKKLHSYANENFKSVLIAKKGELSFHENGKTLKNADDIYMTVKNGTPQTFSLNVEIDASKSTPSGSVTVRYGNISKTFHLYTDNSITH